MLNNSEFSKTDKLISVLIDLIDVSDIYRTISTTFLAREFTAKNIGRNAYSHLVQDDNYAQAWILLGEMINRGQVLLNDLMLEQIKMLEEREKESEHID